MTTEENGRRPSRRALFKYALGTLSSLAAPACEVALPQSTTGSYQIVDRRELPGGGVGLFIAVAPGLTRDQLKALGEQLRQDFRDQPNVIAEIFDDAAAAKTVRSGSRVVGEEQFSAAKAHQRASYQKNARSGQHAFTIFGDAPETIR